MHCIRRARRQKVNHEILVVRLRAPSLTPKSNLLFCVALRPFIRSRIRRWSDRSSENTRGECTLQQLQGRGGVICIFFLSSGTRYPATLLRLHVVGGRHHISGLRSGGGGGGWVRMWVICHLSKEGLRRPPPPPMYEVIRRAGCTGNRIGEWSRNSLAGCEQCHVYVQLTSTASLYLG